MKYSASQRERELYRYYQPDDVLPPSSEVAVDRSRQSSKDPILTAFAQLGALRLNAKRGIITLSTASIEFVVAESGQSLSLQQDNDEQDRLWLGTGALETGRNAPGPVLTTYFCEFPNETFTFIPDLTADDLFKDMPCVVQEPFVRSISCVPLRAPKSGLAIGVYGIADKKVRDRPSESDVQFMHDMGLTVMDYLESRVMTKKQHRERKMVKAIGLFIEGKSTMRESWMELSSASRGLQRRTAKDAQDNILADAEFGVQDPTDDFAPRILSSLLQHQTVQRSDPTEYFDEPVTLPGAPSVSSTTDTDTIPNDLSRVTHSTHGSVSTSISPMDAVQERPSSDTSNPSAYQPIADSFQESRGTLPSEDVHRVFSRASNLIREAIGIDGVVYLDASAISFSGGPGRTVRGDRGIDIDAVTSDSDEHRQNTSMKTGEEPSEQDLAAENTSSATECCKVLGFSTRRRSSLSGHSAFQEHCSFPETLLRRLLRRYPHGKVFNFDEDGQLMSDSDPGTSSSDMDPVQNSIAAGARQKAQARELKSKTIIKTFPEARSVLWFPLWDVNSARWSAASFVWSTTPSRSLDTTDDSSYLAAFGNSIMAEVARLSAQVLARMKTDFISSISHELRSPLHGVLASVEFMQETAMTEIQSDLVSNIHASGKVLLDTMNHVLDFSKVNRRSKNRGMLSAKAAKRLRKVKKGEMVADFTAEENIDISVLCEEVIESVYAGSRVSKKVAVASKVAIILNIVWGRGQYSQFDIDPGALRRILMNLFSNSIKYTKEGWVMVTIWIEDGIGPRRKQTTSNLMFKVADSGKGISEEFLKHQLFKPFEQEDRLASGTGLGLSIIKHIVHDLEGQIDFSSEVGTGTVVKVQIPLVRVPQMSPTTDPNADSNISDVVDMTKGLTFSLEGFERYPDISETPTGIVKPDIRAAMLLKASMYEMLSEWFMMHPMKIGSSPEAPDIDVIVVMQSESTSASLDGILAPHAEKSKPDQKKPICIVLCSGYQSTLETKFQGSFHVLRIQQPCGPHKVAKMLRKVLQQQNETFALIAPAGSESSSQSTSSLAIRDSAARYSNNLKPDYNSSGTMKTDSHNLRALLVDDNEINLKLLTACMEKLKLSHLQATNGLEALETYKKNNGKFDVIFMDISMPVMDGIESAKLIRQYEVDQGLQPVALIALTGAANPDTKQEAFTSGIDMFMTKPVPMQTIRIILDSLKKNGRRSLAVTKP